MLADYKIQAMVAVKDIEVARKFYAETLGLKQTGENQGGVSFESGGVNFFVYVSEFAGTNKATTASWNVEDIEGIVADLKAKGVEFIHYDFEWAKLEGDIHVMGDNAEAKAAWFKDPDGNIFGLNWGM